MSKIGTGWTCERSDIGRSSTLTPIRPRKPSWYWPAQIGLVNKTSWYQVGWDFRHSTNGASTWAFSLMRTPAYFMGFHLLQWVLAPHKDLVLVHLLNTKHNQGTKEGGWKGESTSHGYHNPNIVLMPLRILAPEIQSLAKAYYNPKLWQTNLKEVLNNH